MCVVIQCTVGSHNKHGARNLYVLLGIRIFIEVLMCNVCERMKRERECVCVCVCEREREREEGIT